MRTAALLLQQQWVGTLPHSSDWLLRVWERLTQSNQALINARIDIMKCRYNEQ